MFVSVCVLASEKRKEPKKNKNQIMYWSNRVFITATVFTIKTTNHIHDEINDRYGLWILTGLLEVFKEEIKSFCFIVAFKRNALIFICLTVRVNGESVFWATSAGLNMQKLSFPDYPSSVLMGCAKWYVSLEISWKMRINQRNVFFRLADQFICSIFC